MPSLDELTRGLNEAQAQAVRTLDGPLLVVAGPGSGKTRVLTHRVAAILAQGTPAWRILAVTFTNKAAAEMRTRLVDLVGEAGNEAWVSTFHSLCVKLLRRYGETVGLAKGFTILDQDDSLRMVKEGLRAVGGNPDDARKYQSAISWARNNLLEVNEVENAPPHAMAVAQEYEARKTRAGVVDFDDLLTATRRLLANPEVAAELSRRFAYVLVDEYQDTNQVQYEIIRGLTWESRNLCVVGDHDQSIFAWRGAHPGVLEGFRRDYPEAVTIKLEQNYRSTKRVLAVAERVIAGNPSDARADLWTNNEEGEAVRVVGLHDDRAEAEWVVEDLAGRAGTTAIIVRVNSQTKPFEDALMGRRLNFQLVGAQRFFDRAEVRDAMAWLRVALNPNDHLALTRASQAPRRGIGEKTVAAWLDLAAREGVSPLDVAGDPTVLGELGGRASGAIGPFARAIHDVHTAAGEGPEAAVRAVLGTGLLEGMEAERVGNVNQLLGSAANWAGESRGLAATQEFVESVALTGAADAGSEERGSTPLYLITAHAAKGREFDNVYVVGVEDGIYPHARSESAVALAEERRLLFVACSRARTHLTISWCGRRMRFGTYDDAEMSPFLADVEAVVTQVARAGPAWGDRSGRWEGRANTPGAGRTGARSASRPGPRMSEPYVAPTPAAVDMGLYGAGTIVEHPTFGRGVVVGVTGTNVRVEFSGGVKTLAAAYARLRVV